jgi:hypothetical protein
MAIFFRDRRVASAVNARLAIGFDAELAHGFEPFDDGQKIFLARRFRPFSQCGEGSALFFVGYDQQSFQCGDRLRR